MDNGQITPSERDHLGNVRIRQPKLVSITYTAVYDTGAVQVGAVVSDGSDKPLEVQFRNATGSASSL